MSCGGLTPLNGPPAYILRTDCSTEVPATLHKQLRLPNLKIFREHRTSRSPNIRGRSCHSSPLVNQSSGRRVLQCTLLSCPVADLATASPSLQLASATSSTHFQVVQPVIYDT